MDKPYELARFHRQMLVPAIGVEGQQKLADAHVALVGCGALGCTIADILCRAGVGRMTIIDRDVVELTNLQRQTLYVEADAVAGTPKAEAAAARLRAISSSCRVFAEASDLTAENAESLMGMEADRPAALLDGTDNFGTRYLLNDVCVKHGVPLVYGGAVGTGGAQFTVIPGRTPCLRCLFPDPPAPGVSPTCDTAGILASVSATVAALQALDAIKLIVAGPEAISTRLLSLDLWNGREHRLEVGDQRRTDCPCCGLREFEFLDGNRDGDSRTLCGRGAVQVMPPSAGRGAEIDLARLAERLRPHGDVVIGESHVRAAIREGNGSQGSKLDLTVFRDGRAIVGGVTDATLARSIYARYVGS
ncbi:MAG: ThiF family adenylyltransferase [Phycisphaerales bacterium]